MQKIQGWIGYLPLIAVLVCGMHGQTVASGGRVVQLEPPNGASYPADVATPDDSCLPQFRGGDCHNYCLDLWSNYCFERKSVPGTLRPSFGHGIGILGTLGACHGHTGCQVADRHGCRHSNGCHACARGPYNPGSPPSADATGAPPSPQPSDKPSPPAASPEPPVEPAEPASPDKPVDPQSESAESAEIEDHAPRQGPTAPPELPSNETAPVRRESEATIPVAPFPPDDLDRISPPSPEEFEVPRNELPKNAPSVHPPVPETSMNRVRVNTVSFTQSGTQRLVNQLKKTSRR